MPALNISGSSVDLRTLQNPHCISTTDHSQIQKCLGDIDINDMGPIALLRGIVACGNQNMLISTNMTLGALNSTEPNLFQIWPYIQSLCQGDLTVHYQSFQILALWFARVLKSTSSLKSEHQMTTILKSSWELVVLNWDSPVEDVPELIVDIFTQAMTLWGFVKQDMPTFADDILKITQDTPWFVKGKYRIFAVLLKYINLDQVSILNVPNITL